MNVNIKWENRIKGPTSWTNNYENVNVNKKQIFDSYNIKISSLEENPYIIKTTDMPIKRNDIHKKIMYASKQDSENIHFKYYNTKVPLTSPAQSSFKSKFKNKEYPEEERDIITFDVLNEEIEYKPKRLNIKYDADATLKYKLEHPEHQKEMGYTIDRYYFV